ncbi:murein hydrolase activator EnvC family protein [Lihuaxuella thermophila]|uniref:Murein DD-endopeptidase MepM and murein hydrolase activator NlpD, contain LysM domain n=1 Tax=Lihuaxuella thermophila TaxID=1173111 RepID=A0A1H8GSM2_9BACL|nr:peptidoglycan DD-metalloendopeptidase family protein [Lihuaxuella thermophila]SEN46845.1 Murein DD-endopeptidase MepM and murein hydrolase activator NlpD, contain LysM domain [Lihuaxuella thermophila]
MKRKILVAVLAASLAFSTWTVESIFAAGSNPESKLKQIQEDKTKAKADLNQARSALNEQKKKLQDLEKKVDSYDQQIAKYTQSLAENQKMLEKQESKFKKILVRMYQEGQMDYTVRLLEAETFSEFLARFETVRIIVKQEKAILDNYINIKRKIEKEKAAIEKEKQKQAPYLEAARNEYQKLVKSVSEKNQNLKHLEHQEELTREAIEEKNRLVREASGRYSGTGTGELMWPANGRMTSPYGWRNGRMHEGIDIANDIGTPIYAADSGTVSLMKSDPDGYGYYIVINHGNGLSTLYAHMYRSSVTVSLGQRVRKGQRIASIGNNGRSTGPHLHFEVHKNGNPVDPMPYLQ